jgi:hypothetical protein
VNNPPSTYKNFRREIRNTIENTEIESEDDFDTAVFLVSRDGEATIVHAFEIFEEHDEEIDPDDILYEEMPKAIREFNSKFFALVMPATHNDSQGNSTDVIIVMTSDLGELNIIQAEVIRDKEYLELEAWEAKDPESFENLTVPFRHAITYQG